MTLFRKLAELFNLTSESHGPCYFTVEEFERFDHDGLWSCDSGWFPSYGAFLRTLQRFIDSAEADHSGQELRERLHVEGVVVLTMRYMLDEFFLVGAAIKPCRNSLQSNRTAKTVRNGEMCRKPISHS